MMSREHMPPRELTGRKFAAIVIAGFAIVIAVNLTMATFATRGFSGTVVKNSYVASQQFNDWLSQADAQATLGWSARPERRGNALAVTTHNVPEGAILHADIRRPLGKPDPRRLTFMAKDGASYTSHESLPEGRWIVRITIDANGQQWVQEEHIG